MEKRQSIPLPHFVQEMFLELHTRGSKPSTIKRYQYNLQHFFEWLREEDKPVTFEAWKKLDGEVYMAYYEYLTLEKEYADRTLNHIFAAIKKLSYFYVLKGVESIYVPDKELQMIQKQGIKLTDKDFLTEREIKKLLASIESNHDLTEDKVKNRPLIYRRNQTMVHMLVYQGLTLQEMADLKMFNISFMRNVLEIGKTSFTIQRTIPITADAKLLYWSYLESIPKPVRPRLKTHAPDTKDPFFVAFDYYRSTYRWVYEIDQPKDLTARTIQHTIREEAIRANLGKKVTAQTLRNTCILRAIKEGMSQEELEKRFGFVSAYSLTRYLEYYHGSSVVVNGG